MDEPTTALSDRETDRLFEVVRQLRSEGMAIIYISHRMAEIYAMADRLSVFRDGEYVGELTRPEFSSERIIEMMVGRKLEDLYPEKTHAPGDVVLRVRNMSDKELVKNASFEIRAGEVLGLSGLVGAGPDGAGSVDFRRGCEGERRGLPQRQTGRYQASDRCGSSKGSATSPRIGSLRASFCRCPVAITSP